VKGDARRSVARAQRLDQRIRARSPLMILKPSSKLPIAHVTARQMGRSGGRRKRAILLLSEIETATTTKVPSVLLRKCNLFGALQRVIFTLCCFYTFTDTIYFLVFELFRSLMFSHFKFIQFVHSYLRKLHLLLNSRLQNYLILFPKQRNKVLSTSVGKRLLLIEI